jgi:D-glycero-D-manno-heptose 1,7-bisphosphate phosphatase
VNKAIFLDRDGVINESFTDRVKFVNRPSDFYLLPGVADAIAILRNLGYHIFVVTNQGGIGMGYMQLSVLKSIHRKMEAELLAANHNALIDDIRFCPHRPNDGCDCRKPRPGMILELAEKYQVDLGRSYMIGDMESDVQAGRSAGCKTVWIGKDFDSLIEFAEKLKQG